ncbi:SUMF1/EgtB/PvdO family nonheme iron enzyme, partial [Rhodococcus rhodochrous]|uniref:SUMF1/EgtB/PvdO family nonheme iron enzyme n=1 Tax=Rhodococcus rhodochrous TaxID=1829 RepID=UPI000562135C
HRRRGPPLLDAPDAPRTGTVHDTERVRIPGGAFEMGTSTDPWALDNERPAHVVEVPEFELDAVPVTNRRYLEFVEDGGYERPDLWSEVGWQHRLDAGLEAPQFWSRDETGWNRTAFGRTVPLYPDEP